MCLVETEIPRSLRRGSFTVIKQSRTNVCNPRYCATWTERTAVKQFEADIEAALDAARERGWDAKELDDYASKRLAAYTTAKFALITDHLIKVFVVVGCLLFAGGITIYRAWLTADSKPVLDSGWYDFVVQVCLLAAASHFYDVTRILKIFLDYLGKLRK